MTPLNQRPPPPPVKREPLKRLDIFIIAVVLALLGWLIYRTNVALAYHWNWSAVWQFVLRFDEDTQGYVPNLLLEGLMMTLRLAFWGTILAAIIGIVMGLCRVSTRLFFRVISRSYVELIRNIPPIVFIFVFYFFISSQLMPLLGIREMLDGLSPESKEWVEFWFAPLPLFENFMAGLLCLAMLESAYITELVRAGIHSIDRGQWEAARAVGFSPFNVMREVIMPQAIRRILPPLANQFITLVKDSTMVSLISIQELVFTAKEVGNTTGRIFETWITIAILYFVVCYSLALLFGRFEKKMAAAHNK
ncbi:MAG: amino acid ABC transporter permease [Thiolinea sp.]